MFYFPDTRPKITDAKKTIFKIISISLLLIAAGTEFLKTGRRPSSICGRVAVINEHPSLRKCGERAGPPGREQASERYAKRIVAYCIVIFCFTEKQISQGMLHLIPKNHRFPVCIRATLFRRSDNEQSQ